MRLSLRDQQNSHRDAVTLLMLLLVVAMLLTITTTRSERADNGLLRKEIARSKFDSVMRKPMTKTRSRTSGKILGDLLLNGRQSNSSFQVISGIFEWAISLHLSTKPQQLQAEWVVPSPKFVESSASSSLQLSLF